MSRPNPTLGRRGWVNYLWVSFLLKASVPTHRIDRDHPATADNPRGNRPSPAASTSTVGDLFSPLVKWIPITGGDPFFVPGGDPLPSEQMLTEILLGGAHRRMLNFKCAIDSCARRIRRGKRSHSPFSHKNSIRPRSVLWILVRRPCRLGGSPAFASDSMRFNPVSGGTMLATRGNRGVQTGRSCKILCAISCQRAIVIPRS